MNPPVVADGMVFVSCLIAIYAFGESTTPDIEFISADYPDTILISGNSRSFEVEVTLKNAGGAEAKNVRLDFQPNFGNVSFVSRDTINVQPKQTNTLSIKLDAVNTGETHEANLLLNIVYETPRGKTKSLSIPSITVTIVPTPPPPFYTTPLGIVALVIVAFMTGVAITTIIFRKKQRG